MPVIVRVPNPTTDPPYIDQSVDVDSAVELLKDPNVTVSGGDEGDIKAALSAAGREDA